MDHFHLKFIQAMIWRDNALVAGFPQFPVNFLEFTWYVTVIYSLSGNWASFLSLSQCDLNYSQSFPGNILIKHFPWPFARHRQLKGDDAYYGTRAVHRDRLKCPIAWWSALSYFLDSEHVGALDEQLFCHIYSLDWQITATASSLLPLLSLPCVLSVRCRNSNGSHCVLPWRQPKSKAWPKSSDFSFPVKSRPTVSQARIWQVGHFVNGKETTKGRAAHEACMHSCNRKMEKAAGVYKEVSQSGEGSVWGKTGRRQWHAEWWRRASETLILSAHQAKLLRTEVFNDSAHMSSTLTLCALVMWAVPGPD